MLRDVGGMGESVFEQWTHQVGIVSNKVQQDKTGWDFFPEFPLERATHPTMTLPLDKTVPPMRCFFQVKSTDKRARCCSVTLSNWSRLVKNPLPAFFLVLEFDYQPNPQRAFLVHIDEHYIGRVLKRLRALPPGEHSALHKKSMQFTYNEKNALETLDGEGLMRAIQQYAGENPFTYADKKRQILERIGYEDRTGELQFDLIIPDQYRMNPCECLVDFDLGLIASLEIRDPQFWDIRFGIRESEPSLQSVGIGEVQIPQRKPVGEYALHFRTPDGTHQYRMKPRVYFPSSIHHLVNPQGRVCKL